MEMMDKMENNSVPYEHIPAEKFAFAQMDSRIHDTRLETKARGYFADAMLRFGKNKSSVAAAVIIGLLILYAIFAPILSSYGIDDKDKIYVSYPPYVESLSKFGIFNGAVVYQSVSDAQLKKWEAIFAETGRNPLIREIGKTKTVSKWRGQDRITYTSKVKVNKFNELGIRFRTLSYEEYNAICAWQDETGIQVLYPCVESKDILDISDDPNLWYQISDIKGTPVLDESGNFIPAYSKNKKQEIEGMEYNSLRIKGDDGSYIYYLKKSGAVNCRIDYYTYYQFVNGKAPTYLFGTNAMGQDLFMAIGVGARFSLVFAILVSAINLTIGTIYGAIQGYYGGAVDLILDRIADILSEVPFVVVTTLFQLHLAQKVGVVPAFLFAFVLTGWIGMAALTRKQFYRFKSQEFVYAARTLGASDWRLMFKHVFPNALGTIVTSCALVIPGVVSSETSMTYLGIIDLQAFAGTSIGTLMAQGQTAMTASPHAMFFPALYFALLMISFNLFGNGLRDAFNPSTRGVED